MHTSSDDRSLGELVAELSRETTTLVRQEVALARVELTHAATEVGKDVGFLAVGGAVAYAGLLAIVAAAVLALGQAGVTWWLAALIVGAVVAGIGYLLVRRGLDALRRAHLAPRQTMDTLKDDVDAIKGART